MKGIMEIDGLVVKNKNEAIRECIRLCDMNDPNKNNGFRAYVMRYNDPETIWFSAGYGDYDTSNYVKLRPEQDMEYLNRMDATIEHIKARM